MAYTSLKATAREDWYFDNGCSRHMTGEGSFLNNVKSCSKGNVTFGGGYTGDVVGKES